VYFAQVKQSKHMYFAHVKQSKHANFNHVSYHMNNHLFQCYTDMEQKLLFQEFIHEYEDLVIAFDTAWYYSQLANTWRDLGNEEKYDYYENKSEEYKQNAQHTRV
jgi:hypothetical protein